VKTLILPAVILVGFALSITAFLSTQSVDTRDVLIRLVVFSGVLLLVVLTSLLAPRRFHAACTLCDRALDSLESRLTWSTSRLALATGVLSYTIYWSTLSILRHAGLNSSGFDLAIQHQVVWNLAHGRLYESSVEVANYLGDHLAFTLPFFAPLLWIWDDVRILLVAQSLVLAMGAWPVYRLAARRLGRKTDALTWVLVYFLTPAVGFMNKFDFHDLVVALPVLLAAIDAIDEGRLRAASIWMLLAAATREEVGIAVAALGLWSAIALRRRTFGTAWCIGGLCWAVIALYIAIPHFRSGMPSDTLARYTWLGGTPWTVVKALVTEPWNVFPGEYHRMRKVVFLMQLFWPFAWFPILSLPRLLLAGPNSLISLTSSNISQQSIYFQYNAPMLPFFFWAGIEGHRRLLSGGRARSPLLLLMLLSLAASNSADPASVKRVGRPYAIVEGVRARPNRAAFAEARSLIPADASLLSGNHLAPHFSARRFLGVVHTRKPNPSTSWIILDVTDTRHLESQREVAELISRWVGLEGYAVRFFRDGILVLERQGRGDEIATSSLYAYLGRWNLAPR
jgi:uncharacterized membrane protein